MSDDCKKLKLVYFTTEEYQRILWCRDAVVITIAQLDSSKQERKLCAGSNSYLDCQRCVMTKLSDNSSNYKWVKVFKNGPSKTF